MSEVKKTLEEIENLFRVVVLTILQLDPDAPENQKRVRFPWGSHLSSLSPGSAPAAGREEDVCYLYALPHEDGYNRQRDRYCMGGNGRDLIEVDEHTDIHYFLFANYGAHAYECARDIRDGLFHQEIRRLLSQNHFALITEVPALKRVPELIHGEWWNRVDVSAAFNEYVRQERNMPVIESIRVRIQEVNHTREIREEIKEEIKREEG